MQEPPPIGLIFKLRINIQDKEDNPDDPVCGKHVLLSVRFAKCVQDQEDEIA